MDTSRLGRTGAQFRAMKRNKLRRTDESETNSRVMQAIKNEAADLYEKMKNNKHPDCIFKY